MKYPDKSVNVGAHCGVGKVSCVADCAAMNLLLHVYLVMH